MTDKPTPRLPDPGEFVRGVGTLLRTEVVPPPPQPPPETDWIFEDMNARGELRRRGRVLEEVIGTSRSL